MRSYDNGLLVCCFSRAAATTEGAGPKQKKDVAPKKVETVPKKAEMVSKKAEPVARKEETITAAEEEEEIDTGVCSICVWTICGLRLKCKRTKRFYKTMQNVVLLNIPTVFCYINGDVVLLCLPVSQSPHQSRFP